METGAAKVGRVGASERAVQVLSVLAQAASPLPDSLRLPCCVPVDAPYPSHEKETDC